jgi:hypothetical protein
MQLLTKAKSQAAPNDEKSMSANFGQKGITKFWGNLVLT